MLKLLFAIQLVVLFSNITLARACPVGEIWVDSFHRKDFKKKTGVHYSASQVTGFCRSKNKASKFWAENLVNGKISDWPNTKEVFKNWTQDEIEATLKAFEKIPEFLWNDVKVFRADTSQANSKNLSTSAKEVMVVYDQALKNPTLLSQVLAHELAHEIYRNFDKTQKTEYNQVGQWEEMQNKKGEKVMRTTRKRFVAPDSDLGPDEDFANSVEYYLFDRKQLGLKSPRILEWLDIEYADKIRSSGGKSK